MRTSLIALFLAACSSDGPAPIDAAEAADVASDLSAQADARDVDEAGAEDARGDLAEDLGAPLPPTTLAGRVTYEDRIFDDSGFTGELVVRPSRRTEVSLFSGTRQVAATLTDDEGRYVFEGIEDAVNVRARARSHSGAYVTQVRSRRGRIFELTSPWAPGDGALNFDATTENLGGAFNIADVSLNAFDAIARFVEGDAPTLTFAWDPGEAWPCGSCYSRNVVSLGGQPEDTDEYDDDIILHEFGHYFVEHFSADDSPGGPHRDRQVSPVLAYGEGVAYFFTLFVTGRKTVVDTFEGSVRTIDYENYLQNGGDRDAFRGTTGGLGGRLREELIGGVLLDAFDAPSADEPFDTLALGEAATMRLLVGYFGGRRRVDAGARGIDFADLFLGLQCDAGVARAEVQRLADERAFPWTAPASCP
ncbi:MAG: hypothetical protein AAF938_20595 [Myxococcota bacterium]